ncbi:importin subunit alpha [Hevea brasiliensis]|uniref:importin subunit alpha n=1 Tax=Hevea brasiliensis TaxID=3981 RepID=UPI0025E9FEC0|nr:importin subunit alpha [Hevea brasiliensis]
MTIGNRRKIQKVIAADIIPPLVNLLQDEQYEAEVKWEAVCALSNATLRGSKEHIKYLVNHDCIAYFCEHLLCPDSRTQRLCLVGLKNVLKVGEAEKGNGINLYAKMIKEWDGFSKIENLKTSPDTGEMATNILRSYWRRQG